MDWYILGGYDSAVIYSADESLGSGFTYQPGSDASANALVMTQNGYGGMPSTGVPAPVTISSYSALALLTAPEPSQYAA